MIPSRSEVLSDLESTRSEVLHKIETIRNSTNVFAKPTEDAWNIAQVLEHLSLLEQMVVFLLSTVKTNGIPFDGRDKRTERAVDRSVKVEAPMPLHPSGDVFTVDELVMKLNHSRHALHQVLLGINDETWEHLAPETKHMVFGTLNCRQWVQFISAHERRHLLQIEEIQQSLLQN